MGRHPVVSAVCNVKAFARNSFLFLPFWHKWRILWNRAHRRHVYNFSYIKSGPVPKAAFTHQRLLHQDFSYFLCGGLFSHTKVRNFPFPSNVTATEGDSHFPAKIPPLHFDAENAIMIKRLKF